MLAIWIFLGCGPSQGDRIGPAGRDTPVVTVMLASGELAIGQTILESDLRSLEIPVSWVPSGSFLAPEHVVGRIPMLPIHADEIVLARALADPENSIGLNAVIPRGMRAVPYDPPGTMPVSGGMYVDLWVDPVEGPPCAVAQAVFVMTPNRNAQWKGHSLLLTSEQTQGVLAAMENPSFTVVGRNDLDVNHSGEVACSL